MKTQKLYDFREEWQTFSDKELHEFLRKQLGEPSPFGHIEINNDSANKFVSDSIEKMKNEFLTREDFYHLVTAQVAWWLS